MTFRLPEPGASLADWWLHAKQATPKPLWKGLASTMLLTSWTIWKQRNDCVFEGAQPLISTIISRIKDEAALWATAGAPGLRVLPVTWDIH